MCTSYTKVDPPGSLDGTPEGSNPDFRYGLFPVGTSPESTTRRPGLGLRTLLVPPRGVSHVTGPIHTPMDRPGSGSDKRWGKKPIPGLSVHLPLPGPAGT